MNDTLSLALAPDVAAAARGDVRAFARLVDGTRSTVASIALAIVRDVETSQEVAQDVYLAAWRELGKLREPASFLPWLRQMTRNRARHVLRGQLRLRRRVTSGHTDDLLAAAADPSLSAVERMVAEEEREALARAIDALPQSAREVVVLYYREGRSARQVGELLGMSEDAVKQRLSRARTRLRKELIESVERTAPTAAFTAMVVTALSVGAPGAASATGLMLGKAASGKLGAKAGAVAIGIGALGGAALGLLGGVGGLMLGARELLGLARDAEERRGVLQMSAVCLLGMLGFLASILLWPTPLSATLSFGAMMLTFGLCHFAWLPRITRRRYQAELREDPEWAVLEHRARRRKAVLGFTIGALTGSAPIVAAWFWLS